MLTINFINLVFKQNAFLQHKTIMVPKCPVCGGNMTMHLRCDEYFIKNEHWYKATSYYVAFLNKIEKKKDILLELGVGFNTPLHYLPKPSNCY